MANTLSKSTPREQLEETALRGGPPTINRPRKPLPNDALFITRYQLADRWQLSEESLKRYERRGILHPVKIAARMLRYRMEEIEALEREATLDRAEVTA